MVSIIINISVGERNVLGLETQTRLEVFGIFIVIVVDDVTNCAKFRGLEVCRR